MVPLWKKKRTENIISFGNCELTFRGRFWTKLGAFFAENGRKIEISNVSSQTSPLMLRYVFLTYFRCCKTYRVVSFYFWPCLQKNVKIPPFSTISDLFLNVNNSFHRNFLYFGTHNPQIKCNTNGRSTSPLQLESKMKSVRHSQLSFLFFSKGQDVIGQVLTLSAEKG